ncbi:adenosine deaminase [Trypanosoma cruzi]|uniref:Adenosine deaminase n=1 Tax=Trypanosoma cruzi Dm28c TaxID=1416333 RepID=V5BTS5_TRYCR|nr:hypothetical protein TCDM_03276 [Trypanosoma cruzi Dm28c]RNF22529.1 adenosine deaminase [Trypanosoma cruzi]
MDSASMAQSDGMSFLENNENCSSLMLFEEAWAKYYTRHPGEPPDLCFLPKLDLHCHLNGSISAPLLLHMEYLKQRQRQTSIATNTVHANNGELFCKSIGQMDNFLEKFTDPAERMKYCFRVFENIYNIMNNAAFTRMAVQDLLLHSAAENIFLLEIRTSLREGLYENPHVAACGDEAGRITKKTYVETVIHTVEHLMNGGLVDFETGELLPRNAPVPAKWWSQFQKLYVSPASTAMECSHDNDAKPETGGATSGATQELAERLLERHRDWLMHRMHIRLLLSINRGHNAEAAWEVVMLAKKIQHEQIKRFYASLQAEAALFQGTSNLSMTRQGERIRRTCWVTGVDFSGYCGKNHFLDFLPALTEARRGGDGIPTSPLYASLGVTLHAGEKDDPEELAEMVKFAPERWGHLVYTDSTNLSAILARHDAIELCITSNAVTGGYTEVAQHHIGDILHRQRGSQGDGGNPALLSLLTNESSLSMAMRCRVQRRLARWCPSPALGREVTAIPNVSFHTDDRGVFFTSVTDELELLLQHECLKNETASRVLWVKAIWALQRLSLPHVFELPLEILYSYIYPWKECCRLCAGDELAAHINAHVAALSDTARAELSLSELGWLLNGFDDA